MSFNKVDKPLKGDLIRVRRKLGYYHFGIAISDDRVVHFSAIDQDVSDKKNMMIIETSLKDFLKGDVLEVEQPYSSPFSRDEVVKRAKKHVKSHQFRRKYYSVVDNNCEHFARYCYCDKAESKQVIAASVTAAITGMMLVGIVAGAVTKKAKQRSTNITEERKKIKNSA